RADSVSSITESLQRAVGRLAASYAHLDALADEAGGAYDLEPTLDNCHRAWTASERARLECEVLADSTALIVVEQGVEIDHLREGLVFMSRAKAASDSALVLAG